MAGRGACRLFYGVFLFGHAGDGGIEEGDVGVDVEGVGGRVAVDGVEPAVEVGVAADETGVGGEGWVGACEVAVHDAEDIAGGFEALDVADVHALGDGVADGWIEDEVDEFAEHAGGEFGEADLPERVIDLPHPVMGGRVEEVGWEAGGEAGVFVADPFAVRGRDAHAPGQNWTLTSSRSASEVTSKSWAGVKPKASARMLPGNISRCVL